MNRLPIIVPKAIRPTPTKPGTTTKARNRTLVIKSKHCLFTEAGETEASSKITNVENVHSTQIEALSELAEGENDANLRKNVLVNDQIIKLTKENESLKTENKCFNTEIIKLKEKFTNNDQTKPFSVYSFKDNDKLFRFYTGLQDYKTFKTLFASFGPAVNNLVYYGTNTKSDNIDSSEYIKHGPKRSLTPEQEFFLESKFRFSGKFGLSVNLNLSPTKPGNFSAETIDTNSIKLINNQGHVVYDGHRFKWTNDLGSLKSFVENVIKLTGKWTSPGGKAKQFINSNCEFHHSPVSSHNTGIMYT